MNYSVDPYLILNNGKWNADGFCTFRAEIHVKFRCVNKASVINLIKDRTLKNNSLISIIILYLQLSTVDFDSYVFMKLPKMCRNWTVKVTFAKIHFIASTHLKKTTFEKIFNIFYIFVSMATMQTRVSMITYRVVILSFVCPLLCPLLLANLLKFHQLSKYFSIHPLETLA